MGGEIALRDVSMPDARDAEIERLKRQVKLLEREVSDAELDAKRAREDATRSMMALRQQLGPLYRALQMVFGELEAAGIADAAFPPESNGTSKPDKAKWDEWKSRLGPACAEVIDALLLGGAMTVTALAVACKMGKMSVYRATAKMGQAGIITNSGGKFSLKN